MLGIPAQKLQVVFRFAEQVLMANGVVVHMVKYGWNELGPGFHRLGNGLGGY